MNLRSVRHRGLRQLIENDDPRLLHPALMTRIRNILTVLALADDIESFVASAPRGWRVHQLAGNRRNTWSVSVSGNWRVTFEDHEGTVARLDLEDYH